MRRSGMHHQYGRRDGIDVEESAQLVAVAVDNNKSSQLALKWAADHLIGRGETFILLHVRRKVLSIPSPTGHQLPISEVDEEFTRAFLQQIDHETKELLLPYKCFCSRRGLQCKEVILDGTEIPKAIVDYVTIHDVDKLVLGSSSRNALTRTFKPADVPTCVSKVAPDFCSLYVISKGKISSIRPAPYPNMHPIKKQPTHRFESSGNSSESIKSLPFGEPDHRHHIEEVAKPPLMRSGRVGHDHDREGPPSRYDNRRGEKTTRVGQAMISTHRWKSFDGSDNYMVRDHLDDGGQHLGSFNVHGQHFDPDVHLRSFDTRTGGASWLNGMGPSGYEHVPSVYQEGSVAFSFTEDDAVAEMRRLKLELKKAMNIYDNAHQEAMNATHKSRNIEPWKDVEMRTGGGRFSEVAIDKAELEKAQPAQKMADMEGRKRFNMERKLLKEEEDRKILDAICEDVWYRKYTFEEIKRATNDFSEALKIGEGGYGPVFKSTLDHTTVAIKILRQDAAQGMKQFQQEVEVLSCIRHPNMVLLLGACPDHGCLVYEFMANGSLEDRLFRRSNTAPLTWQLRFKIAAEIATGLLFLHQTKPEPLVHRDLKPGNILLDHNFVSKIADVGLARLVPPSVCDASTQYHLTAAAGTFCYIDPEYQQTGMLGVKSDIYALGIILLQLITAKPPMGLAHSIERAMEMGEFEEMLDLTVPDWPMEEMVKFAKLALKCAELRRKDRPDLGMVVLPELNRLRALAEEMQPNPRFFNHVQTGTYQDVINISSIENSDSGFQEDDGMVKKNIASLLRSPMGELAFA